MDINNNVYDRFGECSKESPCDDGAECCYFKSLYHPDTIFGDFCMQKSDKNGKWFGRYTDFEHTIWEWECTEPLPAIPPDPPIPIRYPDFRNFDEPDGQFYIYSVFLLGFLWIPGVTIMIPWGYLYYTYLQWIAILDFWEVVTEGKWWQDWVIYSFRRAFTGFIMYIIASSVALIPFLNLLVIPFCLWLALADYYDYSYMASPWTDKYLGETIEYMGTQEFRDFLKNVDEFFKRNGLDTNYEKDVSEFIESLPDPHTIFNY